MIIGGTHITVWVKMLLLQLCGFEFNTSGQCLYDVSINIAWADQRLGCKFGSRKDMEDWRVSVHIHMYVCEVID